MPFNSTQKKFLLFILGIAVLVAIILWLAFVVPGIGKYVYMVALGVVGLFISYVSFLPLFNYLSEHADSILGVYLDETGRGIHIFSTFSVSRYKIMKPSLRHIQHYYIEISTGRSFYKVLFRHEQRPIAGESGYTGYSSFEASVLGSEELKQSMEYFSLKTKTNLHLGKQIGKYGKDHYKFSAGDRTIEIKRIKGIYDDVFKVCCYSPDPERLTWKRRI